MNLAMLRLIALYPWCIFCFSLTVTSEPTTMFLMERVAMTVSCVFGTAAEMR